LQAQASILPLPDETARLRDVRRSRRPRDPLAQSVEHLPFKQGVAGSIPARVTIFRPLEASYGFVALGRIGSSAEVSPARMFTV
jgi:hypothetical protein